MIAEKPRSTPRDLFLHLFSLIGLITSASSLIGAVFQLLNISFPLDGLEGMNPESAREGAMMGLRASLSSLVVFFPAYAWSVWYMEKTFRLDPTRRMVGIRKWLTYFTLFVAALVILGNLVVVINYLLNGETTLRFLLKALTVLAVAGGIIWYYLGALKRYATNQ